MSDAELAVIVPVRNGASTLVATVDATVQLFAQASTVIDLLIVDDGSTDSTPDVIGELKTRHSGVRSIRTEPAGIAAARNAGLHHTSAPLVAMIDSDDFWLEPFVSLLLPLMRISNVDIAQGRIRDYWPALGRAGSTYDSVVTASMILRRSVYATVGEYDETLGIHEDYDWLLRAYDLRVPKVRIDDAVFEYRRHRGGMTAGGAPDPKRIMQIQRKALQRRRGGLAPTPPGFASLPQYLGVPPPDVHVPPPPDPVAERAAGALVRVDDRPIPTDGILAFACVRDERHRIEAMLEHHRRIGVGAFLVVDNGSRDGTAEFLALQPDVRLWSTTDSFAAARCGTAWTLTLLERHGGDRWCLVVDADELFWYPHHESVSIDRLCETLEQEGAEALLSVMIDVYPRGPLRDATYVAGSNPLQLCRWFDRRPWTATRTEFYGHDEHTSYFGGARQRVFGATRVHECDETEYTLNKVPLFRFRAGLRIADNFHWMEGARMASGRAALLHWKYVATFAPLAEQEATRGEHWNGAVQYVRYAETFRSRPEVEMFDEQLSVELVDSAQLLELGILDIGSHNAALPPMGVST